MPQSGDPGAKPPPAPKRPGMVDWYSVPQLAKTGVDTLVSTVLGGNIDSRRLLASGSPPQESVFDYTALGAEAPFSIGYIADTGDGWDSTYSLAYLLTAPAVEVEGEADPLVAAGVVVIGGDAVYPVASGEAYRRRLLDPFSKAAKNVRRDFDQKTLPVGDLYIIPGNHDWYDSLSSLSQRFFSYRHPGSADKFGHERKPRGVGQFKTHQPRSYFVLKLPADWEIWGVDIQLLESIDTQQQAFFAWHAESITAKTKVILCCSVPSITYAKVNTGDALTFGLKRIRRLVWNKGARTAMHIAGDIHNYQRYRTAEDTKAKEPYERHHVTCGGGGAFLHPTHSFARGEERIEPLIRYPERAESKRLARRIPLFATRHPGMALLFGLVYLALLAGVPWRSPASLPMHFLSHPLGLLLAVGLVGGCAAFSGPGRRWWGALHGLAHVAAAVGCAALGDAVAARVAEPTWSLLVDRVVNLGAGAAVGGTLFGLYLWASLSWFRIHHNEAFSTLAWPHHKSLMRFTVETDGSLTVRALAVERTAGESDAHPVATRLLEKFSFPGSA